MQLRNRPNVGVASEDERHDEAEPQTDEVAQLIPEKKSQSSVSNNTNNSPPQSPSPSPYKRLALVLLLLFLLWAGLKLRTTFVLSKKPNVVYASRYSKEFKFRPAASPIITETLKDGRIRLRGAAAEQTLAPPPLPNTPLKKKIRKKKRKTGGSRKAKPGKSK